MASALKLYRHAVLRAPVPTLLVMLLLALAFLSQARHFFLDASTDTLMLEHDPELKIFREINQRYGNKPLLAVTYTPVAGDLFSAENLQRLGRLRDEIRALPEIEVAVSLLDVPLFQNPPAPLSQVADNLRTLEDEGTDVELAKQEILASEAYRQQLIDEDGQTAAIAIFIKTDERLERLRERRGEARDNDGDDGRSWLAARRERRRSTAQMRTLQKTDNQRVHETINDLRKILDTYRQNAEIHLGGGPMISDDMLTYIRSDLKIFGVAIFVCIAVILKYFFGGKRWVLLAVACCAYSALVMVGILGAFEWPVTVISSNFISLLLIMNMSLVIHLIVQYREIARQHPEIGPLDTIEKTIARKWTPCLFTTLTTIAGFSSLILCDIKPVKDFGLMMSLALVVSMLTSFILFPSLLALFSQDSMREDRDVGRPITRWAARLVEKAGLWIALATLAIIAFIGVGISRLSVENSFVNHFRKGSEIRRGMIFIDRKLGGTTPVDILLNLPDDSPQTADFTSPVEDEADDEFDIFDEFDEFDEAVGSETYWFTPVKLSVVREAHKIVERQPETGKVSSFASLLRITDTLNDGVPLDAFELAIMAGKLPEYAREILVEPFVSVEHNQFRITARVYDSHENLRRAAFLQRLGKQLEANLDLPAENIVVNGALVLYNRVLQSLFRSQILTLGVVFVVLLAMFVLLFRSLKLALVALFPNLVSALTVLGILGVAGVPLDIMTITIASISIGIAVDDTIHYVHRIREEFQACGNYLAAMHAAHRGVGSAMYYTSVTIVVGFSLLVFSNFIPSVLFGVLTGASMVVALLGALTLLPWLIVNLRAFGPEIAPTAPSGVTTNKGGIS